MPLPMNDQDKRKRRNQAERTDGCEHAIVDDL